MTKLQSIAQDVLSVVLVFTLTGLAIEQSIQPLVSNRVFSIVSVVLLGLNTLVYFADVIFWGKAPTIPTAPTAAQ